VSRRTRLALFAIAGPGLAAVMLIGMHGMPAFGDYHGVYGLLLAKIAVPRTHATDIVTALNFDIRAFDTLGEEFILFASTAGVALLLRKLRHEREQSDGRGPDRHVFADASSGLQFASLALIPILITLGWYVVIHGAITPGGGFQGGVVLAAGPLAILLASRYLAMRRLAPGWALEASDAIGAAGYALIGLAGLVIASVYLKNFLPRGTPATLVSAGMIPINSVAVGLEVTGAFLLVWTEFLDQQLIVQREQRASAGS
jgi:multicomponent Na+:H+ antiporter subunit B